MSRGANNTCPWLVIFNLLSNSTTTNNSTFIHKWPHFSSSNRLLLWKRCIQPRDPSMLQPSSGRSPSWSQHHSPRVLRPKNHGHQHWDVLHRCDQPSNEWKLLVLQRCVFRQGDTHVLFWSCEWAPNGERSVLWRDCPELSWYSGLLLWESWRQGREYFQGMLFQHHSSRTVSALL